MTDFNLLVYAVAVTRKAHAEIDAAVKARRAEFEASIADLLAAKDTAAIAMNEAENAARAAAIEAYAAAPDNKKPHPALGIRVSTSLNYRDEDALTWAIVHNMPGLLKLNKPAFEKTLKAGAVDGIEVTEEAVVTATIASDLSEYEDKPTPDAA